MPIKIKPEEIVRQWSSMTNRLSINIWNFETTIGKEAVTVFRNSFYLGHFNTKGALHWRNRSPNNHKTHPILNETGQMKNSITWKHKASSLSDSQKGLSVFTDPSKFNYPAHRNPGVCYAAVHNEPDGTYTYGNSGVRSIQRQFMGDSSYLEDKINQYSIKIFMGFPK